MLKTLTKSLHYTTLINKVKIQAENKDKDISSDLPHSTNTAPPPSPRDGDAISDDVTWSSVLDT
jgi:hypothetical protein